MQYIITEEQHKLILTEGFKQQIEKLLKSGYEFTKDALNRIAQQYNISFRFLLTYGAGIGSVMPAITEFLDDKFPFLIDSEKTLIAISAISIVFFNTKDYLQSYKQLKKEGLLEPLSDAISFTNKLKDRISRILDVLGIAVYQGLDVIAYTFLLPILPALSEMLQNPDFNSVALDGLINSSYVTTSAVVLQKIIEKLSGKISSKKTFDGGSELQDEPQAPESDIV